MTNPLHNFVSLPLCTRLAEHGLTADTWARWREFISGQWSQVYLVAPGLDHAALYAQQELKEYELPPVYMDTPAYTLSDMLRCLPGYKLMQIDAVGKQIDTYGIFSKEPLALMIDSPADLCAYKVLELLEGGKLTAEIMNDELLTHPLIID